MVKNSPSQIQKKTRLFISYSRKDKSKVDKLHRALSGDDELDVFLDTHDVAAAEEWKPRLEALIRSADTILLVLSPNSASSDICTWEMELASRLNKRIIPMVVKDVADGKVPDAVSRLNYIFNRKEAEFEPALVSIDQALKIDIDWIREHTRIADQAHRWEQAKKLGAQTLRGVELEAGEQWLASQPKDAPAPTEVQRRYIYESRKSAIKRQRMTVAGSIAAVIIVGVLATFAWVQRNAAIEGERKANDALKVATEAANTMIIELGQNLSDELVPASVARRILERAMNLQEQLIINFENNPELEYSKSVGLVVSSDVYRKHNFLEAAEESLDAALAIADRYQNLPNLNHHKWMQNKSLILEKMGNLQLAVGKQHEALRLHLDALKIMETINENADVSIEYNKSRISTLRTVSAIFKIIGSEHRGMKFIEKAEIYQKVLFSQTSSLENAGLLAGILDEKGDIYRSMGETELALNAYQESQSMQEIMITKYPANKKLEYDLTFTIGRIAAIQSDRGNIALAKEKFFSVLHMREKFFQENKDDLTVIENLSGAYDQLRILSMHEGNFSDAILYSTKSLEGIEPLVKLDGENSDWIFRYKNLISKRASTYEYFSDHRSAKEGYKKALHLTLKLLQKDKGNMQWVRDASILYGQLANLHDVGGEYPSAVINYEKALLFDEQIIKKTPEDKNWQMNFLIGLFNVLDTIAKTDNVDVTCKYAEKFSRQAERMKLKDIQNERVNQIESAFKNLKLDCPLE